jgi:hypothetical protein
MQKLHRRVPTSSFQSKRNDRLYFGNHSQFTFHGRFDGAVSRANTE